MAYVDGFIVPVPKNKLSDYTKLAKRCCKIWLEMGALDYHECAADDTPYGKRTSFPRSIKLKKDETVVFAWIVYKSRKDRDRINKAVMNDPRMKEMMLSKDMPLDSKRMIFGGFKEIVTA
jgi:uncharacterized protein YbaA (DUF1428 family)